MAEEPIQLEYAAPEPSNALTLQQWVLGLLGIGGAAIGLGLIFCLMGALVVWVS